MYHKIYSLLHFFSFMAHHQKYKCEIKEHLPHEVTQMLYDFFLNSDLIFRTIPYFRESLLNIECTSV